KQAYFNVVGDPVTMNGLPTTEIVDMGDSFIVRAQRVVIQQWKKDVPWAKKGQVTFGLGGSIAKEAGLLPGGPGVLNPHTVVTDKDKKYRVFVPAGWITRQTNDLFTMVKVGGSPETAPVMVLTVRPNEDDLTADVMKSIVASDAFTKLMASRMPDYRFVAAADFTMGGAPGMKLTYTATSGGQHVKVAEYMAFKGSEYLDLTTIALESEFAAHEPTAAFVAGSFTLLQSSAP
ncbi:MAG: hypothetical protein ACYC4L_21505, partial [Chloroflexota bacterium]